MYKSILTEPSVQPQGRSYRAMRKFFALLTLTCATSISTAQGLDPETFIRQNGFQSSGPTDSGKGTAFRFTDRTTMRVVEENEIKVTKLPKRQEAFQACNFIRGIEKATVVKSTGKSIDVVLSNHGYDKNTIACVFKYVMGANVGTKVMYFKASGEDVYILFITS